VSPSILVVSDYHNINSVRPEAEVFIDLARAGHAVTVMTRPASPYAARFREHGVRVIEWLPREKWSRAEVGVLRGELVAGRYDVLFLFDNRSLYVGPRAAVGLPVKVVVYRGYVGNVYWYDPSCWLKVLHPRIDAYWCNSEAVRRSLAANLLWRKDRAVAINKGHDVEWYAVAPVSRASLGIPEDAFTVATTANFRPMKGTEYLIQATHHVPPAAGDLHLVLIGGGLTPEISRAVEASPLRPRIHLLGQRKDPLAVLAACDGFVLPSVKGESFTKALVEAMSVGLPAVITDLPGNEGVIVDGACGRVVPKRDPEALALALADLASDRARARAWGRAARERIRTRFDHARTVREVAAFLARLVGGAR
jgi:glycosyltransferase involved in cell wall biosynthesis